MTRKKIILVLLGLAVIVLISLSYHLYVGTALLGFVAGKIGGGKKEGVSGRIKSVVLSWSKYEVHLHHWLLTVIFIAIFAVSNFYIISPQPFFGFMSGLVTQGIYCYADWHRIFRFKPLPES